MRFIRKLLRLQSAGYTLIGKDGRRRNRIRGDLIPVGISVIVQDGRHFVRTDTSDDAGFEVYREGYGTFEYVSVNA